MSKQSLIDYLTCRSDTYENVEELSITRANCDFQTVSSPVCERPIWHTGYDVFGVHWTQANPCTHYTQGQQPILTDIENWRDEVRFPDVDLLNWDAVAREAEKLDRENKVICTTLAIGPFERTTTLCSFEDCLVNAIANTDDYADLIGAIVDHKIRVIRRMYEYAHPDVINLHDDWGTSNATFFNPELWRATIKPHTKRLYDSIKDLGMIVSQHSCGSIGALVPDMIEIGCDIWEANEKANDIPTLCAKFNGKICIVARRQIEMENVRFEEETPVNYPDAKEVALCYQPFYEVPEFLFV